MKRSFAMLVLILLVVPAVSAADTMSADNTMVVGQLQGTESALVKSIEGLSAAQWSFKPAPDRWSVAECAEHIVASESFIRDMVVKALKNEPTAEMMKEGMKKDEMVLKGLADRTTKFKAPEPLIPTNKFATPGAAIEAFRKARAETVELAAGEAHLRTRGDKHFALGPLDGAGWFLFLSAHSGRHTAQIEEVKAHADFPK